MKALLRRAMPWAFGALLLLGAGVITVATPSNAQTEAPFFSALVPGEQITTRTISAVWRDTRVGERVDVVDGESGGLWVVVDLDVSSPREEGYLWYARLVASDGTEYRASERVESLADRRLSPGIVVRGSLAFELPAERGDDVVRILLGTVLEDARADGLLTIDLDLSEYPPDEEVAVLESTLP